jgi:hypothetical protein
LQIKYPYTSYEEYCLLDGPPFLNNELIYNTKVTAVRSVFSLIALLMLATLITETTSFHATLAQPIMDGSNMSMGNGGSDGGGAGMDFNPMSFANNIFNASSLYGSVGISMVNGVKVTSINLLENNEISVTLRHSAAADTANNVNMSSMSAQPRVTVTAIRAPLNLKDLMSLASESSKMMTANNTSNPMMMGGGPLQVFGGAVDNGTNNVNPLSFLTGIQIGSSSTIANADWKLPQIVRMGLTSMMGSTNNNAPTASTADFIIVSVIPYTGKSTSPAG